MRFGTSCCSGAHHRSKFQADSPFCTNCGKPYDSTSRMCPEHQRGKYIYQYKSEAKVGYLTAKAALLTSAKQVSQGHSQIDFTKTRQDVRGQQDQTQDQRHSPSRQLSNVMPTKTHGRPRLAGRVTRNFKHLSSTISSSYVETQENPQRK